MCAGVVERKARQMANRDVSKRVGKLQEQSEQGDVGGYFGAMVLVYGQRHPWNVPRGHEIAGRVSE